MIDFEAELAKFQPSLDVEQAEDAIYGNNTTDVTDLLQTILKVRWKVTKLRRSGWKNDELSKM